MIEEWEEKNNLKLKETINYIISRLNSDIKEGLDYTKIYFNNDSERLYTIRAIRKYKLLKFIFLYMGSDNIFIPINKKLIMKLKKLEQKYKLGGE